MRGYMVTLVDGTEVDSYSEAWRHECEARMVLNMTPLAARREYLYGTWDKFGKVAGGIKGKRGDAAVKRLEDTMTAIWKARRANRLNAQIQGEADDGTETGDGGDHQTHSPGPGPGADGGGINRTGGAEDQHAPGGQQSNPG